jgi:hypothetical protein
MLFALLFVLLFAPLCQRLGDVINWPTLAQVDSLKPRIIKAMGTFHKTLIEVYKVADYLDINRLRALVVVSLENHHKSIAQKIQDSQPIGINPAYLSGYIEQAKNAYTLWPKRSTNCIRQGFFSLISVSHGEVLYQPGFVKGLETVPELAMDVLHYLVRSRRIVPPRSGSIVGPQFSIPLRASTFTRGEY